MESQATTEQQSAVSDSTIDEIKALAPLSEEWWLAYKRKLSAGKHLASAEWNLTKRALTITLVLALCMIAALSSLLIVLNGAALYLLIHFALPGWLIALILISANVGLVAVLATTTMRVVSHVSMSKSWAMVKGENSLDSEDQNDE
ncbi:hypothetical protein [Aliiglaciecola litoralis]|uniref:Phage holin family protein n=1 Tax=Aliiglaciecola litoralis TaxID=582857 RepID=A0ABP3WQN9_9ALTE